MTLLNDYLTPAKSKEHGCRGCRLFQYAPHFSKHDRESYQATLDPHRKERKNRCHKMDGIGPDDAEVLVVMDSPSKTEDALGESFSGGEARMIRRNASVTGIEADQWRWTYLSKCGVPGDVKFSAKLATYCTTFLADEIKALKPKTIIAFGSAALSAILGKDANIFHYVCQPQDAIVAGHPCIVYPMHAPWYIQRNDYLSSKYVDQFEKLSAYLRGEQAVRVDSSLKEVILDVDAAIALCERLRAKAAEGRTIEVDLETSGLNPYKKESRISVVSLGTSTKRGYAVMYNHNDVPWTAEDRERFVRRGLKPLLRQRGVKMRLHNGKFDVQWIRQHFGFWPRDIVEDTMLTHYAFDENMEHGLKPLSLVYTDMGDYDAELEGVLSAQTYPDAPRYDLVEYQLLGKYAAMDVVATRKLALAIKPHVIAQGDLVTSLAYMAMPAFSATLTRMEYNGCHIDQKFATDKLIPHLKIEAARSYDSILAQTTVRQFIRDGEAAARAKMTRPKPLEVKQYFEFKLNSPQQLQTLLYDPRYYGHEATVFTDKGAPSTDKEALNDLAALGSPIAKSIQENRLDVMMCSTFGEPILARLAEQGDAFLHGGYLLHGTKTGRLSSRNPNLQNQPNKGNGAIKRMFDSRYGDDGVFIQIDFSQIELRVLAALSGDPTMIAVYLNNGDIHTKNACMIFGLTEEELATYPDSEKKRMRTVAKRVVFGLCYGIGGPGIQHTLKADGVIVDEETAKSYIEKFLDSYPRVAAFIQRVHRSTEDSEFALSAFGRRRRLESVKSSVNNVVARALRQAGNHIIQSTAGDMTTTALALYDQQICLRRGDRPDLIHPTIRHFENLPIDERWARVHPILQVHDMIGVDCHKDVASDAMTVLLDMMQNVIAYAPMVWGDCSIKSLKKLTRVPIIAEPEVGPNWRDAVKVKTGADIEEAMHVARAKRAKCDEHLLYEWGKDDDKAAREAYKKVAA